MKYKLLAAFVCIFISTRVFAGVIVPPLGPVTEKVSLSALVQEARKNNPRLKAAHYRAEAAKARVALFRNIPDPMVEYEYDKITPAASMNDGGKVRPMKTMAISQQIPFPTKVFMRKKSAQKEADALDQEYKETERGVVRDVKNAYATLFLNRQKVDYLNDSLSLMRQFVEVVNKKYAVNKAGQQDVLRAQVEYSKLSNTLILYGTEANVAESLLISLLGRTENASIDIPQAGQVSDLGLNVEDAVALARKDRPELKSVRAMFEKAQIESSLSKQEFLPDITLKYKRDEVDGKFNRIDQGQWTGSVGINVPIWFWGKQLPEIREARADLEAARADYEAAENTAVFEVKSAFARYDAARKLVGIYATGVLPQATSAVTTARRAYESGTLSFLDLLDSMRILRDLQMEYFGSVAALQIALADLEQAVGGDLEK
ncbi:MAG: TolC family protein [Candidatus Omnitrophica bacterium]|nr:TolC family protein [Candidatus Omnitrophota bacterium]